MAARGGKTCLALSRTWRGTGSEATRAVRWYTVSYAERVCRRSRVRRNRDADDAVRLKQAPAPVADTPHGSPSPCATATTPAAVPRGMWSSSGWRDDKRGRPLVGRRLCVAERLPHSGTFGVLVGVAVVAAGSSSLLAGAACHDRVPSAPAAAQGRPCRLAMPRLLRLFTCNQLRLPLVRLRRRRRPPAAASSSSSSSSSPPPPPSSSSSSSSSSASSSPANRRRHTMTSLD